jgi:hypothetical protein
MKRHVCFCTTLVSAFGFGFPAYAQFAGPPVPGEQTADFAGAAIAPYGVFKRDTDMDVRTRARPEYESLPIHVGAFDLRPEVVATLGYDDNIFASPVKASDAIARVEPDIVVKSNWARNSLSFFGRASNRTFLDHSSESELDFAGGGNGRLDIAKDAGLMGGGSYEQDTEPRTSPSSPVTAAEPVRFTAKKAYLGGVKQFNRLRLSSQVNIRDLSYSDPDAIGGGTVYQRDRSVTRTSVDAKAEYAFSPAATFFIEWTGNKRDFRHELIANGSRDSKGYELTAGSNFEIGRLVRGEIQAGYLKQVYKDPRYNTVSGLSVRGFVHYYPTPLLTISASGGRAIQDADVAGSSGYIATSVRLQADYELLRQLILSADATGERNKFRGVDRRDNRQFLKFQGEYLINRSISFILRYELIHQVSKGTLRGVDYRVNRFSTSLSYKL